MGFSSFFEDHFMFFTSLVSIVTAGGNLGIIWWMSLENGLNSGLGLAAIGIITFCGTLLSSSIFEEHRHNHGTVQASDKIIVGKDVDEGIKKKIREIRDDQGKKDFTNNIEPYFAEFNVSKDASKLKKNILEEFSITKNPFIFVNKDNPKKDEAGNFIEGVIAGTGIMRKSLAASLVVTYIVLIGLSFSAGTLGSSITGEDTDDSANKQSVLGAASHYIFSGQFVENAFGTNEKVELAESVGIAEVPNTHQKSTAAEAKDSSKKSVEQLLLEKDPKTLIEHFTIVVTAVVGFYFGSNTLESLLKARREDRSGSALSEINEKLKKHDEIAKDLKEKITSNPSTKTLSKDAIEAIDKLKLNDSEKIEFIKKMLT